MNPTILATLSKLVTFMVPPVFYLLPGIIYSAQYATLRWQWIILLYLFVLTNQSVESDFQYPRVTFNLRFWLTELLNIGLIVYFSISDSIFLGSLLVLYSILIHIQCSFKSYQLHYLVAALMVLFKVILMNAVSFYLSTSFIPLAIVLWSLPVVFPFLLAELDRWHKSSLLLKHCLLFLCYLIGLGALWSISGAWALLIIFTFPAAYCVLKWKHYLGSLTFYSIFSAAACLIMLLFN